jgi:AcrR family transcriptional regulator
MMPRAALTHDEIQAFRERICAAAAHLFAASGYEAVTLRAIAAELGCSPMTPYRYFSGKDEIFALVKAAAFGRFADAQERAACAIEDPTERLAALGRAYLFFAVDEPDAYRIMFELRQGPAADQPELQSEGERAWRPLRDGVAGAIEAGVLEGDVDTVAHVFWAGVHGLASLYLAGKLELGRTLEALVPALMGTLFRGNLGASGDVRAVAAAADSLVPWE